MQPWRLATRTDRRAVLAVLGIAMALILPLAGGLVVQGLQPVVSTEGWIATATTDDGMAIGDLQAAGATAAVAMEWQGDVLWVDHAIGSPPALMPHGAVSASLPDVPIQVALLPDEAVVPGASVVPMRGADAFEVAGIAELRSNVAWAVLASLPAVVLVVSVFADAEARSLRRTAATFFALGAPKQAVALLRLRIALVVLGGSGIAALLVALLVLTTDTFHPEHPDVPALLLAGGLPVGVALLTGWLSARRITRLGASTLRGSASMAAERSAPMPGPLSLRPILLGLRPILIMVLAAALFMVDVGVPLAAASIPATVAGDHGEWVDGAGSSGAFGGQVPAAKADALRSDPAVEQAVAEILVPTTFAGRPVLVRGGSWTHLADYHELVGEGPDDTGIYLGARLAGRTGLRTGDTVLVPSSEEGVVLPLMVQGLTAATGPLGDEAFVSESTGQALADLDAHQATVIRVRPGTADALAAMERAEPRIEVTALRTAPIRPEAGEILHMQADLVNRGGADGVRPLAFHINGDPVAHVDAAVPAWGTLTVDAYAVTPRGEFVVTLNPTGLGEGAPADVEIVVPGTVFAGFAVSALVLDDGDPVEGTRVTLYGSLADADAETDAVASATTDAGGQASLFIPDVGTWVVKAQGHVAVMTGVDADRGLDVEQVWTEPAHPVPGDGVTVFIRLTSHDEDVRSDQVDVRMGGNVADRIPVTLVPGESTVLESRLTWDGGAITVLGTTITPASGVDLFPSRPNARSGTSLQADVSDRLLGDAEQAMAGLTTIALASTLSAVWIVTDRTLHGRAFVADVLHGLGWSRDRTRRRATMEAGMLAGACFSAVFVVVKGVWPAVVWFSGATPFAHQLPDPFDFLFYLQGLGAFAGLAAVGAYVAAGNVGGEDA